MSRTRESTFIAGQIVSVVPESGNLDEITVVVIGVNGEVVSVRCRRDQLPRTTVVFRHGEFVQFMA